MCYGWGTTIDYLYKIGDFAPKGARPIDPKFQREAVDLHQPFFFSEN